MRDLLKEREAIKLYRLNLKKEVIEAYGGNCFNCSESRIFALNIDHIDQGAGLKHRRSLGNTNIYKWLKSENFPSGFRLACWNCNWLAYLEIINHSHHRRAKESRRRKQRQKLATISLLGGKCVVCNTNDTRVLTIQHKNNDGATHRKSLGIKSKNMWKVILKCGNLEDFECRCRTCNSMDYIVSELGKNNEQSPLI